MEQAFKPMAYDRARRTAVRVDRTSARFAVTDALRDWSASPFEYGRAGDRYRGASNLLSDSRQSASIAVSLGPLPSSKSK